MSSTSSHRLLPAFKCSPKCLNQIHQVIVSVLSLVTVICHCS